MKPQHIGVIMDGNRRWARAQGKKPMDGHLAGYKNFYELSRYTFLEKKIPYLSAFVFSTENWKRTEEEVGFLMRLVTRAITEYLDDFHRDNIKILILGSRDKLSKPVLKAIEQAESKTAGNTGGTLALCFNYGGQQEIVDAAKAIIEQKINADSLDLETFESYLYKPEVPPLDLIIRTSGEQRLSGFMLYRAAYSELLFLDKHWPDFTPEDIDFALDEFANRQRRYGA
ncbi:MAG TPA: polyprenyl diphosphate synthase [Candidatus Saccharimonadales bacterium]|nr:polyprenyl diphosphate synthase [Candidatus Saccharimonadales bacterium]